MTYYQDKGGKHEKGEFKSFDHVTLWVGNAKQAASFYCTHMGFEPYAYRGLETGERNVVSHVIRQGDSIFQFQSALNPGNKVFGEHIEKHGDAVKDVSFTVEDCASLMQYVKKQSEVLVVKDVWVESDDDGSVTFATVRAFGDTTHTLIERGGYKGLFLPGYKPPRNVTTFFKSLPSPGLNFIDHVVSNHPEKIMSPTVDWYEKNLLFHRFWSIDDDLMHTEYSSLRSVVVTNHQETIKMPVNEPAAGKRKSQVQEFCDYNDGSGIQHVALNTPDIITAITNLRNRGMEFLSIPDIYYDKLKERLSKSRVDVKEDMDVLQKNHILIDFDDNGYLLQLFTRPMQDRPTLFLEVIQRRNHNGFGAGNFKTLYESVELEQAERGNLV